MAAVPQEHQTRLVEVVLHLIDQAEVEGGLSSRTNQDELAESLFNKLISGNALDGLTADELELLEDGFRSRLDLLSVRVTEADSSLNLLKRRSRLATAQEAYDETRAAREWLEENRPEPRPVLENLAAAQATAAPSPNSPSIEL